MSSQRLDNYGKINIEKIFSFTWQNKNYFGYKGDSLASALLANNIKTVGGSFGIGYGPIVTALKPMTIDELKNSKIAIPGKMTSAFLLLQLMIGKFDFVEMNFSDIPNAVKTGEVDAGLVIHETQLSFEQEGVMKILDVGKW